MSRHARARRLAKRVGGSLVVWIQATLLVLGPASVGRAQPADEALLREAERRVDLARIAVDEHRPADARSLYEEALAMRRQVREPVHADIAECLHGLGVAAFIAGDFETALTYHEEALEMARTTLGDRAEEVAEVLRGMGQVLESLGRLQEAERRYGEALSIFEPISPDHWRAAEVRVLVAGIQYFKGDERSARIGLERALATLTKEVGDEHPATLGTLHRMGAMLARSGEPRDALRYLERAERAAWRYPAEHPLRAEILDDKASALRRLGRVEDAKKSLVRAFRMKEHLYGPAHPNTISALHDLAVLLHSTGDRADAEVVFEAAMTRARAALPTESPLLGRLSEDMSVHLFELGKTSEALDLLESSLENQDRLLATFVGGGSEREIRLLLDEYSAALAVFAHLRWTPSSSRAARLAFEAVLRRKGREMDVVLEGLEGVRRDLRPDDEPRLAELRRLQAERVALWTGRAQGQEESARRRRLAMLDREIAGIETHLRSRYARFRGPADITVEAVQAKLRQGQVLVEIFVYPEFDSRYIAQPSTSVELRYAAGVLTSRGEQVWTDLGPALDMERAAIRFRTALQGGSTDVRPAGRDLYDRTLGRIERLLEEADEIIVSPNGTLQVIPFAALVDRDGNYLVERFTIGYANSGRDLLSTGRPRSHRSGPILVGGLDYGNPTSSRVSSASGPDLDHPVFSRLTWAGSEIQEIAKGLGVGSEGLLTGACADEGRLKTLAGPSILHLATHGFFQPISAEDSSGWRESGSLIEPLLRSGVAVSGANHWREATDANDGILTALEMRDLDLGDTEMVVLSACETGLGEISYNRAVYGLRRALALAGARTQVMSLWRVDDRLTKDLMVSWYARMKEGMGRAEAMRVAQLALLASAEPPDTETGKRGVQRPGSLGQRHPYHWASFIVVGETGPLDPETAGALPTTSAMGGVGPNDRAVPIVR